MADRHYDCPAEHGPFVCTLDAGHHGPHKAATGPDDDAPVAATWTDDAPTEGQETGELRERVEALEADMWKWAADNMPAFADQSLAVCSFAEKLRTILGDDALRSRLSTGRPEPDARIVAIVSAVVHAEEYLGPDGHRTDLEAFRSALQAPGVAEYIAELAAKGLAPVKRSAVEKKPCGGCGKGG